MAISGVENLSTAKLLGLCRDIFSQFEYDSSLKEIEGLLRMGGAKSDTTEILDTGQIPKMTEFNIHAVLDVIKRILPELKNRIAKVAPKTLIDLHVTSCALSCDDESSVIATAEKLNIFISSMVASGDIEQENLAEMLYGYIHLGAMFSGASDINKMTKENCAIIIGPHIDDALGLVDLSNLDMFAAAAKIDLVKSVIFTAIESKEYDVSFIEKYVQTLLESKLEGYNKLPCQVKGINEIIESLEKQKAELKINIEEKILNIKNLESAGKKSQDKELKNLAKDIKKLIKENKLQLTQLNEQMSVISSYLCDYYIKKQEFELVGNKLELAIKKYKFVGFLHGDIGLSTFEESPILSEAGKKSKSMLHLCFAMSKVDTDSEQGRDSIGFVGKNKFRSKAC